jgi:hypothetical protein
VDVPGIEWRITDQTLDCRQLKAKKAEEERIATEKKAEAARLAQEEKARIEEARRKEQEEQVIGPSAPLDSIDCALSHHLDCRRGSVQRGKKRDKMLNAEHWRRRLRLKKSRKKRLIEGECTKLRRKGSLR